MAVNGLTSIEYSVHERIRSLRVTAENHEQEAARHLNLAMDAHREIHELENALGEMEWTYADLSTVRTFSPDADLTNSHVCGSL